MKNSFFKTDGNYKKDLRFVNLVIHSFAAIHALTCLILLTLGISDGLFLTILTIAMIVLLINFFNGTLDVFLSLSLLSCLSGFYMGTNGAILIGSIIENKTLTHVIATILVTESLGWLVFFILRKKSKNR